MIFVRWPRERRPLVLDHSYKYLDIVYGVSDAEIVTESIHLSMSKLACSEVIYNSRVPNSVEVSTQFLVFKLCLCAYP